ncbi:Mitochondrial outer membrane protein iml2 [Saxophila tyrrhenica]|uniref:Inclusion body clearance protein IML2 n=1 Tax=Saxophila tyrrhenica TaxID=1690608 RepID=A0AAV9P5W8_9PEZI|nr:Mitochondrial outer membrane protein iml2 [Saxophila tyrrhenica]
MRRMGGWLGAKAGQSTSKSMTALDEHHALQDAMTSAALIINDEVEQAELQLSKGTSPFHKLGRATAIFLRATLGFEKEIMEQAGARIAEAEESAAEHQRRAQRDHSTSYQSQIYPAGAEYALCHAEAQLMSAVIAVLNESLTESLRGFYKLRKAFGTLYEIHEAEKTYLRARGMSRPGSKSSSAAPSSTSLASEPPPAYSDATRKPAVDIKGTPDAKDTPSGVLTPTSSDEDDDLEFVDAEDGKDMPPAADKYRGHLDMPNMKNIKLDDADVNNSTLPNTATTTLPSAVEADSKGAAYEAEQEADFRTITSDPIDLFIHSGTGLCYGLLQLLLSMIPPAFGKLLSLFSFRGDRETGLRMLWSATKFKHTINGAMAGLITLGFHNGAIAFCDILTSDAMPEARLRNLLSEMRSLYPKSKLWLLEECRMLSRDRDLAQSVSLLQNAPKSSLKQVDALALFETSLSLLYLHRYEECADSFVKCVGMNNWSHAMYFYIAGACHVELYRIHKQKDAKKAAMHAERAEKLLREVPAHSGKKKLMARQLPFDVFVGRKIMKWDARSKARGCSFVDAVGVSPATEMTYLWSGFTRMQPSHVEESLSLLAWSEGQSGWDAEPADERALLAFLRGVCQRFLSRPDLARSTLTDSALCYDLPKLKACEHPDTWPLPVAHYELAVLHWTACGGEKGDKEGWGKCSDELAKVEGWEAFELDARVGMKVRTGRETLRRVGGSGT